MYTHILRVYYSVTFCVSLKKAVCKHNIRKSGLRYKFLILDTYHSDSPYLVTRNVRLRGYLSKPKEIRK